MKKVSLVLALFLLHHITICQVVKPFNLKDFEGKKIVSLFKSTTESKSTYPGFPFQPTNQYNTVDRTISFKQTDNHTLVQKIIKNVNIDSENLVSLEHRIFDTNKKFDRSEAESMIYGRYDNFIDKPFQMVFNNQNKRIDTLLNFKNDNNAFIRAWSDEKLPFLQENWLGLLQMSLPTETEWKVGQTWVQTIRREQGAATKNETITNTYTVKSINNDIIVLSVKGINIPDQVIYKRSDGFVNNTLKDNKITATDKINYTIEQKAAYEGTIKLDAKNNFIQQMEFSSNIYKKISVKDSPTSGPEENFIVTIENKLEDLK